MHTLDVTLATPVTKENIKSWKAVNSLSSDHLPTLILYQMHSKAKTVLKQGEKCLFTLLDKKATINKLNEEVQKINLETINLMDINNIIKGAITMKTMRSTPITCWTKELALLVTKKNKARHAITKAKRNRSPTDDL